WLNPNEEYEKALCDFASQLLEHPERNAFLRDLAAFVEPIAFFGAINSLVLVALKLTAPGVPDIYQGAERLVLSLVDPDNRRPVDYAGSSQALEELDREAASSELLADVDRTKLLVTRTLLRARKDDPELFAQGTYVPLQIDGEKNEHLFAFARQYDKRCCVVVLPRWCARLANAQMRRPLGEIWGTTELILPSACTLRDVFTGAQFDPSGEPETLRPRAAELL